MIRDVSVVDIDYDNTVMSFLYLSITFNRGIYYNRIDIATDQSLDNGAVIPTTVLKNMIIHMVDQIDNKPTCVLSNVIEDPYLSST
jgi:hypothetical protein